MDIWARFKQAVKEENTTQEWIVSQTRNPSVNFRTLQGWISKGIMPRADQLYSLAKALNRTVEWLLGGEEGLEYLRSRSELGSLKASDPSIKLANDISKLNDSDREELEALIALKLAREEAKKARHA